KQQKSVEPVEPNNFVEPSTEKLEPLPVEPEAKKVEPKNVEPVEPKAEVEPLKSVEPCSHCPELERQIKELEKQLDAVATLPAAYID
ncbi:23231_t:CDS:1, partial [Racocetra persica]